MADTAHEHTESHGHSTAAWTGVGIILFGSLVMSLAVIFPSAIWFGLGAVVCVAGVVIGKMMSMAGFGDKIPPLQPVRAGRPNEARYEASSGGKSQHDSGIS